MKKLKFNEKNELTKDEMKKINGGLYGCIYLTTHAPGCPTNDISAVCDYATTANDCYWDIAWDCAGDPCCKNIIC